MPFSVYGFNWYIGSRTVKLYVLHDIFSSTHRKASRWNPILLKYQPVINFIVSMMILVWIPLIGFTPQELASKLPEARPGQTPVKLEQCPSNTLLFQLFLLVSAILMTICFYLSFQTRHIVGAFSEARFNVLTAYNIIIFGTFAAFIVQNADSLSPRIEALYVGFTIAWITTISSILIVDTRLYAAMKGLTFDRRQALIDSQKKHDRLALVRIPSGDCSGSASSNQHTNGKKTTLKRGRSRSEEKTNHGGAYQA